MTGQASEPTPDTESLAERAGRRRRRWAVWIAVLLMLLSLGALAAGAALLTSIDATQAGLECGAPLDNPGWDEGSPCHGAVNRQTAFGWTIVGVGVWLLLGGIAIAAFARPKKRARDASQPAGDTSPSAST